MLNVSSLLVPLSVKHIAQLFPRDHVGFGHADYRLFVALVLERGHRRQYIPTHVVDLWPEKNDSPQHASSILHKRQILPVLV